METMTVSCEKVYCENCANVWSSSDCFGGVYAHCKVKIQTSQEDTPVDIVREYLTLEEMNANNDCEHYLRKTWIESIWANTLG